MQKVIHPVSKEKSHPSALFYRLIDIYDALMQNLVIELESIGARILMHEHVYMSTICDISYMMPDCIFIFNFFMI